MNTIKKTMLAALGLLLVMALVFWFYQHTYEAGFNAGQSTEAARWQAENERILKANKTLMDAAAVLERRHNTEMLQSERTYTQEHTNYEQKYNGLMADIERGKYRVYITATPLPPAGNTNHHNPACPPAPAPGAAQRCELDAATVSTIANLTRDGDTAIMERNECIERYNQLAARLEELQRLKK